MIREADFPSGNLILSHHLVYFSALQHAISLNEKFVARRKVLLANYLYSIAILDTP